MRAVILQTDSGNRPIYLLTRGRYRAIAFIAMLKGYFHISFQQRIERAELYDCPAVPDREYAGMSLVEAVEPRRLFSSSPLITGTVVDAYRLADGTVAHVALADRTVYLDSNHNEKFDRDESFTTTNLSGDYRLPISAGSNTVRLVERSGWSVAGIDSATLTVSSGASSTTAGTFSTRMIHPTRVDVLALYTAAAGAGKNAAATATQIRSLFLQANQVYANSDTNVVLNLIATNATSYRESGSIDRDLDALGESKSQLSNVATLRTADHADIVSLFTSGTKTKGNDIGVGYEYDPDDSDPAELGFNVVAIQNDAYNNDAFTLAHEIGHNLGAGHDKPDNDGSGVTSYAYGYHYHGTNGRLYQDVMDYSDGIVLPFFSTPLFSWAGEPIGNAATADNARIIRLEAPNVGAYR